jgi:hypothetical protein
VSSTSILDYFGREIKDVYSYSSPIFFQQLSIKIVHYFFLINILYIFFSQLKGHGNSYRLYTGQQERNDYGTRVSMNKNEKHDIKRIPITNLYKPLNEIEFLSKTHSEIRQEFRKMPNPPAKDPYAAK